jgi:competence protein ComEA
MAKALTPRDILALAGAALAVVALGGAGWLALAPRTGAEPGGMVPTATAPAGPVLGSVLPAQSDGPDELLVDVQGAVAQPGLVRLPLGSRVADAIAAAGGYTKRTDLLGAATAINLAAPLADGVQVFVPIAGVAAGGPGSGGSGSGSGGGGLVNLNSATPEELEALPGIGPVTVQKIVAARQERPFTTLDELVEREVMNRGQLDDIRDLVTL